MVGSDDGKVALDTLNPNLGTARWATRNVKHRFVASGVWDLNYFQRYNNAFAHYVLNGWQISGIFNARSGQPYSPTVGGNADINRDGNTRNDRAPMAGRNIYTLPSVYTLDARVTKIVPLWKETVRLRLVGQAFNMANRANVANVNRTPFNTTSTTKVFSPVAIFGTASTAADPRILQIAAKIEF
ncbi:MAG: hypothetical protein QM757_23305 [Paludibaculum sp.]